MGNIRLRLCSGLLILEESGGWRLGDSQCPPQRELNQVRIESLGGESDKMFKDRSRCSVDAGEAGLSMPFCFSLARRT